MPTSNTKSMPQFNYLIVNLLVNIVLVLLFFNKFVRLENHGLSNIIMTHSDKRAYFFKIDTTLKYIRNYMQSSLHAAGIDITVDQWVLIDHIQPNPGISQIDLAKITTKDAPTVTRILEILIKKGWVERVPDKSDRRRWHIYLTSMGENVHQQAFKVIAAIRTKAWEGLADEDYEHLVKIMETIHANIKH